MPLDFDKIKCWRVSIVSGYTGNVLHMDVASEDRDAAIFMAGARVATSAYPDGSKHRYDTPARVYAEEYPF